MTNIQEVWRPVKDYEYLYEVSNQGRVRNVKNYKILKPYDRAKGKNTEGYLAVCIYNKANPRTINKSVHSLVMQAFIGDRPHNMVIHHIDGNKSNNKLENLKYCTQSENRKYDFKDGRQSLKGSKNTQAILNERTVLEIVALRENKGHTYSTLSKMFNLTVSGIANIFNGHTWSHTTNIKCTHNQKKML